MISTVGSVELPGRVRLPYAERGDPSGVPVLLLHGVTDSWRSFERVLPHLSASVRALALTQRGHGDADRPDAGYRARDLAEDVAAFADALGLDRIVVVGHSMGGAVAQRFAIDHPDRALGLVLAGTFAGYRHDPAFVDFCESVVATVEDPVDPAFVRDFQRSTLARPVPPEFFETAVDESLKVPARVWRAAFGGFLEEEEWTDELRAVRAPTLVVWGTEDAFAPRRDQDALLAAIPGSRLLVYEGAGHALHWEEPERFAADVAAFVGDVARRAGEP